MQPRPPALRVRTNTPAIPFCGGGLRCNAGTYPLTAERTGDRDSFDGDASVETTHGPRFVAQEKTVRSAAEQAAWGGSCAHAFLADALP